MAMSYRQIVLSAPARRTPWSGTHRPFPCRRPVDFAGNVLAGMPADLASLAGDDGGRRPRARAAAGRQETEPMEMEGLWSTAVVEDVAKRTTTEDAYYSPEGGLMEFVASPPPCDVEPFDDASPRTKPVEGDLQDPTCSTWRGPYEGMVRTLQSYMDAFDEPWTDDAQAADAQAETQVGKSSSGGWSITDFFDFDAWSTDGMVGKKSSEFSSAHSCSETDSSQQASDDEEDPESIVDSGPLVVLRSPAVTATVLGICLTATLGSRIYTHLAASEVEARDPELEVFQSGPERAVARDPVARLLTAAGVSFLGGMSLSALHACGDPQLAVVGLSM